MKTLEFEFSNIVRGKHYGYVRHVFTEDELCEIIKAHVEDECLEDVD